MGKLTLQEKLNMANGTVAKLIKEVQTVKQYAKKVDAQNEILRESNATLHADYALLEEKYYTQSDNYTELDKEYKALLDKFTEISAENHALKQENERTNRHINLAENQLHKEQQPLVVNHYHNCTINK